MSKFKIYCKCLSKDLYTIFLKDNIIFYDEIELFGMENKIPISGMNKEQRIKLIESLEMFISYNTDFSELTMKHMANPDAIVNFKSNKEFIRHTSDNYPLNKARAKLIIKFILTPYLPVNGRS